jgi:hypothetical protein
LSKPITGRGGRPIKQKDEKRCIQINIRITIAEDHYFRQQATTARLSVAEFIRQSALNIRIVTPLGKDQSRLSYEINRLGNNANQIARRLHQGSEYRSSWDYVAELCAKTLEKVVNDP